MGGQEELRPLVTVVDYLRVNLGSFKESDLAAPLAGQQEDKTARSRAAYTLGRPPQSERARHPLFPGRFLPEAAAFSKTRSRRDTAQFDASSAHDSQRPSGSGRRFKWQRGSSSPPTLPAIERSTCAFLSGILAFDCREVVEYSLAPAV